MQENEALSPRNAPDWGDLQFSDEESDFTPPEIFDRKPPVGEASGPPLTCCHLLDDYSTPENALWLAEYLPSVTQLDCTFNMCRSYVNYCVQAYNFLDDNVRLNLLDHFMRMRHDLLALRAGRELGLSADSTDVRFCDVTPIESKKTPDFITVSGDSYIIIEVTAVSSPERAYKKKGHIGKGYESKYHKEISELESMGLNVTYVVIVFDMSDPENNDHNTDINQASELMKRIMPPNALLDIDFLRRELVTLTKLMLDSYSHLLCILYGTSYSLKSYSDLSGVPIFGEPLKEYKGSYTRVGVSNFLFDRVVSITPKLSVILDRASSKVPKEAMFTLVFEQVSSNFRFRRGGSGLTYDDWIDAITNCCYSLICTNLVVVLKGVQVQTPKADFEFMHYDKTSPTPWVHKQGHEQLGTYALNHSSIPVRESVLLMDHSSKVYNINRLNLKCRFEDEDLEDKLLKAISEFDSGVGKKETFESTMKSLPNPPLCSYSVNEGAVIRAIESFRTKYVTTNTAAGEITILPHVKQPFLYPVAQIQKSDYTDFRTKPTILSDLGGLNVGDYTSKIIKIASSDNFEFGSTSNELNSDYENAKKELSDYHKVILAELKELHQYDTSRRFPRMKELKTFDEHHAKLSELNKMLHKAADSSGFVNKNLGVITLGRGRKSQSYIDFKKEMAHFRMKDVKSHMKGVGMGYSTNNINSIMTLLKGALLAPSDSSCMDPLYDPTVSDDARLLMQMKQEMMDNNSEYYDYLRSTNLYHSCSFVSRLCHTLMFHSQSSLNNSRVVVDNLGYDKVLLIIRGGKKIFSTKKSKLFRLVIPIFSICSQLYQSENFSSDFKTFVISGRTYLFTPWMNMHETLIADGITFLHRTMGFAILNRTPDMSNYENLNRVYFNIILAMHNRRQTESMLHNLRYIFMNCMSEVSAIEDILPEVAGFNYDYFQAWIRQSMLDNFVEFATKLIDIHKTSRGSKVSSISTKSIRHPFNGHIIKDYNTLALGIYSSYLMSKAPITQLLEQVKNMKGIMENHETFMTEKRNVSNCMVELKSDQLTDYYSDLSKSDFNFDPSYCFLLGKFMGDYLMNLEKKNNLAQKWDSILNKSWDGMANTKGLRGSDKDFFGNKGYYVVYKDVLKDSNKMRSVMDTIQSDMTSYEKEKIISEANSTFKDRIASNELDGVVFHVVDKVQRGGSREIYVMDLETKVHQQVIEEYTKYICKLVPNEMISIPSNKRLSTIHSKVFEGGRDESEKYYWVLDCRKWAPKSIVEKFMIFLMGAKDSLPETFVVHALNFFNMMLGKKVYTRPQVVDVLTKSKGCMRFKQQFKFDEEKKAYYFDMPYSWVMGIFNYFSSLMHVSNQMHASHMIRISAQRNLMSENILHMVAHSDDSAGKILVNNRYEMLRASFIYETLMHSANHLLSKKKCNQGKVYYEFLSILYIGGTLLSLLSKFTGIFNYHPTDKGYCSDMTDAYSKCTELLLNGATFEQCYLAMKIQSMLIYRFYFGSRVSSEYYKLPPSMFGIPDSHPLMVLLCGSDADLFRIFKSGGEDDIRLISAINEHLLPLESDPQGMIKSFKCTPRVSLNNKLKALVRAAGVPESFSDSWTLKNVSFENTYLNAAQFVTKLRDKSFVAALQDESLTRRLSRSYYFRSHLSVHTCLGDKHPREVRELIFLMRRVVKGDSGDIKQEYSSVIDQVADSNEMRTETSILCKMFDFLYCEVSRLYDYLDKIHYNRDSVIDNPKTCKPVYISVQKTTEECPVNYNTYSLCSWIKEPEFRNLLPDTRGYITAQNFVVRSLSAMGLCTDDVEIGQLSIILQKLKQRSKSEYFCYSNLPSDLREINTYQDVLNFLSHNTFQNKMVRGLAIQFSKTIGAPVENITADLSDEDLQYALTMFVTVNALTASPDFDNGMMCLDMYAPDYIGGGIIEFGEIIRRLIDYWSKHSIIFNHIQCLMVCAQQSLEGNRSFDAALVRDTYLHCFVSRQMLVDNVWLGLGKLYISLGSMKMLLVITNIRVTQVLVQCHEDHLNENQVAYINICLCSAQLPRLQENMRQTEVEDWGTLGLCYDNQGSYYIGDVHGSLRHLPAKFDLNLTTPLSSFDKGRVKSFKGSKLIWETILDEKRHVFNISTLPIETQNAAVQLRGTLVSSVKNERILSKYDGTAANVMVEICAKELDLERHIDPQTMMKNYNFTDCYKIIKACVSRSLAKAVNPELKLSNIPAPDGGLMNLFIQYSKYDPTFDFKWQRSISSEYMALKSSQPESFLSEIIGTVKLKYNSLYTDIDKEALHRSLLSLGQVVSENELESKMMNLLCTWGYLGVAGALEEMEGEKKMSSFAKLRVYDKDSPYVNFFKDLFFDIFVPLMKIYGMGLMIDGFAPVSAFGCSEKITYKSLNYYIMSMVHNTNLMTYSDDVVDYWRWESDMDILRCMISSVLSNEETSREFQKVISSKAATRNLPTNIDSIPEWKIAARTLRCLYINCTQRDMVLDYNQRRDLSTSTENPYVLTRDILASHGVKMKSVKLFHYGALSTHLYDILKTDFKEGFRNQTIWFKVEMVPEDVLAKSKMIYYNSSLFPEKRFTQDFLEGDEYDEMRMEYQSPEPDLEYVESLISDYKNDSGDPYEKREMKMVKAVVEGKLKDVLRVKLKIVILVGGSLTHRRLSRLRMLGDEILIVSDALCIKLGLNKCVRTFRCTSRLWEGYSILNPRNIFYFVITRDLDDASFWERILEAEEIKQEQIMRMIGGDYMLSRNKRGLIVNDNESHCSGSLWNVLDQSLKLKLAEELEEAERAKSQSLLASSSNSQIKDKNAEAERMRQEGLDEDQVSKYLDVRSRDPDTIFTIESLIEKVSGMAESGQAQSVTGSLKIKMADVIQKTKSAAQHEMMMQAPLVFGGGRSKGKPKKNNLFREKKVIAELESLCPGLVWKILSGSLYISSDTYEFLKNQIISFKMMVGQSREHKKGKQFVINLAMLILNDANIVDESDDDLLTWRQLASTLLKLMLLDEDKVTSVDWDFHDEEPELGTLRYGISGSQGGNA